MNKPTITIVFALSLALAVFLVGCGEDEKKTTLGESLKEQGIVFTSIDYGMGGSVEIEYESSKADKYDSQIVSDWAMIMGSASEFGYDPITIVNTVNGEPVAKIKTSKQNVDDFMSGSINETDFWMDVEIKSE